MWQIPFFCQTILVGFPSFPRQPPISEAAASFTIPLSPLSSQSSGCRGDDGDGDKKTTTFISYVGNEVAPPSPTPQYPPPPLFFRRPRRAGDMKGITTTRKGGRRGRSKGTGEKSSIKTLCWRSSDLGREEKEKTKISTEYLSLSSSSSFPPFISSPSSNFQSSVVPSPSLIPPSAFACVYLPSRRGRGRKSRYGEVYSNRMDGVRSGEGGGGGKRPRQPLFLHPLPLPLPLLGGGRYFFTALQTVTTADERAAPE